MFIHFDNLGVKSTKTGWADLQNLSLLLVVLIGAIFALQPSINAVAARGLGSPIAATALSVAVTLVASVFLMVLTRTVPSLATFATLPWWVVFGGLIGVFVLAGGAALVPVTGAALFFVALIAGQLLGSVLMDHYGVLGLEVREINWRRILGMVLAFSGVVLIRIG